MIITSPTDTRPSRAALHLALRCETLLLWPPQWANASRGLPCHTQHCSDELPCTGSQETCP